ncbi:class II fructose-bisphosphate aldolase [Methylococcus capsulatus]|uniref:Class II fructose-bisphosphate aldolase n=1 Tax=Methylococcus capsulatus TaxID=414 RepID=A0ABZ2F7D7_METCP
MHGSSSVPEDWAQMINDYGGDIGQTYGVPVEEIVEGIRHGVRKVNIDTDLRDRLLWRHAQVHGRGHRRTSTRASSTRAQTAMTAICRARYEADRRRRPGRQDQAPAPGRHELGVCPGQTRSDRPLARRVGRTPGRAGAEASGNGNASDAIGKQGRFETRPAELLYPLTRT